nr:probable UDP-N-acetylglucosamine--peptide N-acetylglucosaminyltransferase SPINDLY isoform X1 [Tanacetum cinerariifolium]
MLRLYQAVSAYEKAEEILLRGDEDIDRPELLSLVHTHHAQSILAEGGISKSQRRVSSDGLGLLACLGNDMFTVRKAN